MKHIKRNSFFALLFGAVLSIGAIVGIAANKEEVKPVKATSSSYQLTNVIDTTSNFTLVDVNGRAGLGEYYENTAGTKSYYKHKEVNVIDNTFTADVTTIKFEDAGEGKYYILEGEYYLSAANDNFLVQTTTKDKYAQWTVSFSEKVATITNVGYNTRFIQFNGNKDQERFAAYKSGVSGVRGISLYVEGKAKTLDHITATGYDDEYYEGETFDTTGMVVIAFYSDGTSAAVTDYTYEPVGALTTSDTKVVVTYKTETCDCPITVIPDTAVSIEVRNARTSFYVGEDFVFDAEAYVTFESGRTSKVDPECDSSAVNKLKPGTYEVKVWYQNKSVITSYNVTYSLNSKRLYKRVLPGYTFQDGTTFILGRVGLKVINGAYRSSTSDFAAKKDAEFSGTDVYLTKEDAVDFKLKQAGTHWNIYVGDKLLGTKELHKFVLGDSKAVNTWDISFSDEGFVTIASTSKDLGRIMYNDSGVGFFRTYTSQPTDTVLQIDVFVLQAEEKKLTPSVDKFVGEVNDEKDISVVASGCEPTSYAWESANTSVATVDASSTTETLNTITLTGVGTTTVTVTAMYELELLCSCEIQIECKVITHNVVEPGSDLVINVKVGTTFHALMPTDLTDKTNPDFADNETFKFEAYPVDECYAIKSGSKYLSARPATRGNSDIYLTDTIEDYFLITKEDDNYILQSQETEKYLQLYKKTDTEFHWYCFENKQANYALNLTNPQVFDKLECEGTPDKLEYEVGEDFEISPAKINALYVSGLKVDVTSMVEWDELEGGDTVATGRVDVSGSERVITIPLSTPVHSYEVTSLILTPIRTSYFQSESVREGDLTIKASLEDKTGTGEDKTAPVDFDDVTITPATFATVGSEIEVTVNYEGVTNSYKVEVKAAKYQKAPSVTNGDQVVFVCEELGYEMDTPTTSLPGTGYVGMPSGKNVFTVERGSENNTKKFKDNKTGKYLGIDGSKPALIQTAVDTENILWTISIVEDLDCEAVITNVSNGKALCFNSDSLKFAFAFDAPASKAIQLYKDVTINPPQAISVKTNPDKTEYTLGETFDPTGLVIHVDFGGGASTDITSGFSIDTPDMTTVGSKNVRVTYFNCETSFNIVVKKSEEKLPASISVSGAKTEFIIGDDFVFGGTVTLKYTDDSTRVLNETEYTVYGWDHGQGPKEAKTMVIQVKYNEDTTIGTSYEVHIKTKDVKLAGIEVVDPQLVYEVGSTFNVPQVRAIYTDETSKVVGGAVCSGYNLNEIGTQIVTVEYTEGDITKSTIYTIEVVAKVDKVTSIEVVEPKTIYGVGEAFVTPKVIAHYESGLAFEVDNVIFTGFNSQVAGNCTVTATYTESGVTVRTTYDVVISGAPIPTSLFVKNAKLTFTVGEEFKAPEEIIATYSNGSVKDVTADVTISGYDMNKTGTQTVTITYTESGVTVKYEYKITVNAKGGCGGSVMATSIILSSLALLGATTLIIKKKKEK